MTVLARRKVEYDPKDENFWIGLSHTDLRRVRLSRGARFDKAHFRRSWLRGAVAREAQLRHARLDGADLTTAKLNGALMEHADLKEAALKEADLTAADLTGADLSDADLSDADLTGAKLMAADLTDAKLHRAALPIATLMEDAVVTESQLKAACGWTQQHTEATFETSEVRNRDLTDADRRKRAGLRELTDASSSDRT